MQRAFYFGFSLIELLITLTIIGIISCVAYPSYTEYITQTHRAHAVITLHDMASRLETYYTQNHSYKNATLESLHIKPVAQYQIEIRSATDTNFALAATPIAAQAKADKKCGTLILDNFGRQQITGDGEASSCWRLA